MQMNAGEESRISEILTEGGKKKQRVGIFPYSAEREDEVAHTGICLFAFLPPTHTQHSRSLPFHVNSGKTFSLLPA